MKRKTIIFSGIILIIIGIGLWNYGFFNRFNYLTAKSDIANNSPHQILIGESMISTIEMNKVSQKYGFTNVGIGCLVSGTELKGIEIYNAEIEKHLNEKNGADWKIKYLKEVDSIAELQTKLNRIPKTAFWAKKSGSGNWFNVDWMHNHKNNAIISIYDKSGELIIKGRFMKVCPTDELKFIEDLKTEIDFYDGKDIQLKDNCYLLKT